ncbi:MAG: PAQR family membrane homeostasis protein TrhA [Carbonactinosporaceae bacterium]
MSVSYSLPGSPPRLRGWLHAGIFPLSLGAGTALVAVADTASARISCGVYAATAALLFGVSTLYHRGRWSPQATQLLRRLDHASIFLIIAGTYTPFAVLLLDGSTRLLLLSLVWSGALAGSTFRILWLGAPRWFYTATYLGLGWTAAFFVPAFVTAADPAVLALAAAGGLLYSTGALVYAVRRPDPWPHWFGYHEVFHACTLAAYVAHYAGVALLLAAS